MVREVELSKGELDGQTYYTKAEGLLVFPVGWLKMHYLLDNLNVTMTLDQMSASRKFSEHITHELLCELIENGDYQGCNWSKAEYLFYQLDTKEWWAMTFPKVIIPSDVSKAKQTSFALVLDTTVVRGQSKIRLPSTAPFSVDGFNGCARDEMWYNRVLSTHFRGKIPVALKSFCPVFGSQNVFEVVSLRQS